LAVVGNDVAYGIGDDPRTAFAEKLGSSIGCRVLESAVTGSG
jgi:hypothetical protein